MARPHELIPGNCYFTVGYYDSDLLIPEIETLIYRDVSEYDGGGRVWIFERPLAAETEEPGIPIGFPDEQLDQILDFDGLRSVLGELSGFHPLTAPVVHIAPVAVGDVTLDELRSQINAFVSEQKWSSLSITISFTDDGLSLGKRRAGGFEMGFFPHPKRDDKEERVVRLFAARGVDPHVSYLANNGRVRVLAFAIPEDERAIRDLCAHVFTEIYGMRADDTLRYSAIENKN